MRYEFAPLEGITDATYRRTHHKYFPGIQKYFMPFISPTIHRTLTARELRELPYADSVDFDAVPQFLGKNTDDILWAIHICQDLGYSEVNINLGCPSGTVVSKGKGSGLLVDLDFLNRFLSEIYSKSVLPVSLKTRIGFDVPEEFPEILSVYNHFPVSELIIHPRVRKSFYQGTCNLDSFQYAQEHCAFPLTYNGNLNSIKDIDALSRRFPRITSVMIGRGLIANPGMLSNNCIESGYLERFLTELEENYVDVFQSKRNTLFRMKEIWHYLIAMFDESEKLWKKMRKTTDYQTFISLEKEILHTCPIRTDPTITW